MHTSAHWLEELSAIDSLDIFRDFAYSHACESGPLRQQLISLIANADYKGLVEFELNYLDPSLTPYAVKHIRQTLAYFQKLKHLEIGVDKREVALNKFLEAEERCKLTNEVIKHLHDGTFNIPNDVNSVLHAARRKITRILGNLPRLDQLELRFGPGATRGVKKKDASIRSKIAERLQCSEDLLPMVHMVLSEMPHLLELHAVQKTEVVYESAIPGYDIVEEWCTVEVEIVDSKVTFQEKNAKTLRAACTEPGLNVIVQLGIGDYIAQRLAAFGIDIRDQTLNQKRAARAVINDEATVDLSSASDNIAFELVADLLPWEWFDFLRRSRSSYAILPDGTSIKQAKFSSMGNGFTFPLETLIFWAISASCCDDDRQASAYGDDLIVPSSAYPLLAKALHYCGFVVNKEKSFDSGPFRESCGKDYFSGFDVRPYFPKEWVSARQLFTMHNWYVRDGDFDRAKEVEKLIHPALRIFGPDKYGDGHLIGEHPRKRSDKHIRSGYSGYLFFTYTLKSVKSIRASRGDYVLPLYSIYRRGTKLLTTSDLQKRKVVDTRDLTKVPLLPRQVYKDLAEAPLPLRDVFDKTCGEWTKELSLPGGDGYKKISIYTLG